MSVIDLDGQSRRWDAVLEVIEEDVQRTENWLIAILTDPSAFLGGEEPVVPELAELPALPAHVLPRIVLLRERISRLTLDLESAMAVSRERAEALRAARPHRPQPTHGASRFVDRTV